MINCAQRSRSVDTRRQVRPPPRPPTSSSTSSAASRTTEEHRILTEKLITTRTRSVPRLNLNTTNQTMNSLRKINMTSSAPIAMLYKVPTPAVYSCTSSSSSLSTETTLRVSSPEPDEQTKTPLKPLYITEIIVPAKAPARPPEQIKTTVVTITDKSEVERRNRDIQRLEIERKSLLTEKELLLREVQHYKQQISRNSNVFCLIFV